VGVICKGCVGEGSAAIAGATEVNVAVWLGIPDGIDVAFGIQDHMGIRASLRDMGGDYLWGSERSAPVAGAAEGDVKVVEAVHPDDVDVAGGIHGDLGTKGRFG